MIQVAMTLRVLYNYFLVLLGIRRLMPRDIVNRVTVRECGEPMVRLPEEGIIVAPDVVPYGRTQVVDKLVVVSRKLETLGLRLQILELYCPAEWWHFAYGDRIWAAYKHKRHAIYGNVTFQNSHRAC